MKFKILVIASVMIFFVACKATKTTTTTTTTTPAITYGNHVKAIIDMNCANSCHNAGRPAGGIDLTTFANVKEHTINGKLLPAIQHLEGADPMPKKNPKLDDASIQVIIDWANAGAPE